MPAFDFTVIIDDRDDFSDAEAVALVEAGCDDGTLASGDGVAYILFTREAPTRMGAIQAAISDIRKAGLDVKEVKIDAGALEGVPA